MAAERKLTPWMWGVGGVTFLAGLLFGYDPAFIVAQFFLSIVDAIGESSTFVLFSCFCVVTYVFVWRYVPRGRSLEEIQERWVVKGDRMLDEEPA